MSPTEEFRAVYALVAGPLKLEALDSPHYERLHSDWLLAGQPRPIDIFLIVNARTVRDEADAGEDHSEDPTTLE